MSRTTSTVSGDCWRISHCFASIDACDALKLGVRGADEMYCEFDDDEHFLEFYEHGSDPWQLDNCAAKVPPAKLAGYHARLSKLRACAGVACRR